MVVLSWISWIWGCLKFVNCIMYTCTLINFFVLCNWNCYQSGTLYYVHLYVSLSICYQSVINLLSWEARKFWKYIVMLPILSTKCVSQFTLVIATVVSLCSMHESSPIFIWKFCVLNTLVLSPCHSSLTLSPPLKRKRKRLN